MKQALFLLTALLWAITATGQTAPELEQGLKPFGSYNSGNIDVVNVFNGNLMVNVPLISYPQRGGTLKLEFALLSNNKTFAYTPTCDPSTGGCSYSWTTNGDGGFGIGVGDTQMANWSDQIVNITQNPDNPQYVTFYTLTSSDGASHDVAGVGNGYMRAADTSGYLFQPSTGVITDRSGISYGGGGHMKEDANGNFFTLTSSSGTPPTVTDTVGRVIPYINGAPLPSPDPNFPQWSAVGLGSPTTDYTSCTGPLPIVAALSAQMPSPGGTGTYKFCFVSLEIATYFHVSDPNSPGGYATEYYAWVELLQSVVLPDGTAWTFEYNSSDPGNPAGTNYGDLTKITFPTGGTLTYVYTNDGPGCYSESRSVATRTLDANDGTGPHTWTYTYDLAQNSTTVTDPEGNDTVHSFSLVAQNAICNSFETGTKWYQGSQGSGTLLKTTSVSYSGDADLLNASQTYSAYNVLKTQETTSWPSGQVSNEYFQYDPGVPCTNCLHGHPVNLGNTTLDTDYDYSGALLRQTSASYEWQANSPYLASNLIDLPATIVTNNNSLTRVAETDYAYDDPNRLSAPNPPISTQHGGPPGAVRGNLTSTTQWLNNGTSPITYANWYDTGERYQNIDANTHATTYSYDPAYAGAYVTQTCFPQTGSVTHCISGSYDSNSGLLTSYTDQNSQITNYSYDNMFRLTKAVFPDVDSSGNHGETDFYYYPTVPFDSAERAQRLNGSTWLYDYVYFDGVGRTTQTRHVDSEGDDYVNTTYDANGHTHSVTNPYRSGVSSPTDGTTYTAYDALGRVTTITKQGGGTVQTNYQAFPTVIVTDETLRTRQSTTDALGRLTQVVEPNPITGSLTSGSYTTNYIYDALDNMHSVNQVGDGSAPRTRSFVYDSLSRLTSSSNPESGIINYIYDGVGNILSKTSPAPNQTGTATSTISYCYDTLDRITSKSYTAQSCPATSPTAVYSYDQGTNGISRLTGMVDSSGQTTRVYDPMGRVTTLSQTVSGLPGNTSVSSSQIYTYWLDGSLKTLTYPSGRVVNYDTDSAGRNDWVYKTDPVSGQTIRYVQVNSFFPPGEPAEVLMGNVSNCYVGALAEFAYNGRLQPTHILYTTNTDSSSAQQEVLNTSSCPTSNNSGDLMHRWYNFTDSFAGVSGDNGNIAKITNCIDTNRSQNFIYDGLNRITAASTDGPNWGEQYTIDPWGNLTDIATTKGMAETLNALASTQNQLNLWSYDAAGNQLNSTDGPLTHTYAYDPENHIATIDSGAVAYTYDGEGGRVIKNVGGVGTVYWKGANGNILAESDLSGTLTAEYIFFNGKRIARTDNPSSTTSASLKYYLSDDLGSTSMITDATFSTVLEDEDYYPYGREVSGGGDDSNYYLFTGKERDAETGLDSFGVRYYSSTMGRWMGSDPSNLGVDFALPQTWNHYNYAMNNPLIIADRDGMWPFYIHNRIIDESFPGMSKQDLKSLKDTSWNMDYAPGQQDPSNAPEHEMSDGSGLVFYGGENGNAVRAEIDANNYIDSQVQKAQEAQAEWVAEGHAGISPKALQAFGNALHTVTDGTSPAHKGYQPWANKPWWHYTTVGHFLREVWRSSEETQLSNYAAQSLFRRTFGDAFDYVFYRRVCARTGSPGPDGQWDYTPCQN